MLILYSRFFKHQIRLLWMVCFSAASVPVLATECNTSPVFAFSRALYLEQYETALSLLPVIERERDPETAQFLHLALGFKRAYETADSAAQQAVLDEIDNLITSTSGQLLKHGGYRKKLSLANIMIHTARLQLAAENVLRAAKLAKQGKQLLDEIPAQSPDDANALLAKGLYQYYTGSENEALGWLMRLWSLQGDKTRGRKMIERAVERSADHAFEAARSLLSDVAWNRQDTCRYMPLFNNLQFLETGLTAALQDRIGLFLFCGQADQALEQITALENSSERAIHRLSERQANWLFEARLHALAALGDIERLNKLLVLLKAVENTPRYRQTQFALAKGLDVRGAHENARSLYREVTASNIGHRYRNLAQAYIQMPYKQARPYLQRPANRMKFACDSG